MPVFLVVFHLDEPREDRALRDWVEAQPHTRLRDRTYAIDVGLSLDELRGLVAPLSAWGSVLIVSMAASWRLGWTDSLNWFEDPSRDWG